MDDNDERFDELTVSLEQGPTLTTDEHIRLEALALAVQSTAQYGGTITNILERAGEFDKYIRGES